MHDRYFVDPDHGSFGWLKTLALIIVMFALMIGTGFVAAKADTQCATACRAAHDQCRILRQGAPACDLQLQACVQRCLPTPIQATPKK
jgi:hypothetical protein